MVAEIRLLSLLLLSVLLLASGFASSVDTEANNSPFSTGCGRVTANIDKVINKALPTIRGLILKNGLDPLKLDNWSYNLNGIFIKNRVLSLTNGWFQGLSRLTPRTGSTLSYEDKVLTLSVNLGFNVLDFNYEYMLKDFLMWWRGYIHGRFTNNKMQLVVSLDMRTYKIILQSLKIINIDKLDITLSGHIIDPVVNAVIKGLTNVFHRCVVNMVEKQFAVVARSLVDEINEKTPLPDQYQINDDLLKNLPISVEFYQL